MELRGDVVSHPAELPLPDIATLMKRYIEFVEPLDGVAGKEANMEFARRVIRGLSESDGEVSPEWRSILEYFRFLESLARKYKRVCNTSLRTSHIAPLWNSLYLCNRDPLPFGWNYTLYLDAPSLEQPCQQLNISLPAFRAAIIGAASFHVRHLVQQPLFFTPEGQKRLPETCRVDLKLCRDQFTRLLSTVRVPHLGVDGLRWSRTNKVLILRKGHPFVLDWIRLDNQARVSDLGARWLEEVVANARLIDALLRETSTISRQRESPLVLSSGCRGTWARIFEQLWKDQTSKAALDAITSCSFAICIDEEVDLALPLHGGKYPENRYPDINVAYIVDPAGGASCNIEHSWGDGSTMLLVCGMIAHYSQSFCKQDFALNQTTWMNVLPDHAAHVKPVHFGPLSKDILKAIMECRQAHHRRVNETELTVRHVCSIGTSEVKRFCRVSPDAFVHAAFHLAQQRVFGDQRSTYCALLMKKYHHGRTETLRTVTHATQAVADAVTCARNKKTFNAAVAAALQKASQEHYRRITVCRAGNGFHRAVTLLRRLHDEARERLTSEASSPCTHPFAKASATVEALFFESSALRELSYNYLSTSNISGSGILAFCFTATHPDGIGIGYSLFPDHLTFSFSVFKNCGRPLKGAWKNKLKEAAVEEGGRRVCELYADTLEHSVRDLYRLSAVLPLAKL
ncbi:putative carnitine O-palmitoyltransferase [Trypanosoma rangeli]|uniref:Putative carnitine O-palmitoyltransferase n=1 Tax=Trypanosoma rangeli TaxID=5698 RepID=A0A3R7K5Z4_TRYRA|nr:putative carnitine O-palmitoyltransferase [Trypanosoma rangeli]RNF02294.1 putative carnitine O-palmitoyltransferase [Trypanosoma rangeli]|eukprot:RNF02294.1 putative carnitine O-palmitoyltransferase [Trypanosoma rangeli]